MQHLNKENYNTENADAKQPDLISLRGRIDEIDREIVRLYEERMQVTDEVGEYKIRTGRKVYDKDREKAKIEKVRELAHSEFTRKGVTELFSQLMSMSRKRQFAMLEKAGVHGRLPFIEIEDLDRENIRVVFQGEEGAYSHAAMAAYFGEDVNSFHVPKFRDAMEAIAENYIVAEQIVPVEHVLMACPGTRMEDIRRVISHPQALSQCEGLFQEHRDWEAVAYGNTALAARKIAKEGKKDQAAIGSAFAARRFGLEVLQAHVNDQEANATRFMIVTNQRVFVRGAGKISICFELPHSAGTLYNILSNCIFNDVNMTHIESRPIPGRSWEYRFFIDFEGNLNDPGVRNALRGIREEAINMKILGNY